MFIDDSRASKKKEMSVLNGRRNENSYSLQMASAEFCTHARNIRTRQFEPMQLYDCKVQGVGPRCTGNHCQTQLKRGAYTEKTNKRLKTVAVSSRQTPMELGQIVVRKECKSLRLHEGAFPPGAAIDANPDLPRVCQHLYTQTLRVTRHAIWRASSTIWEYRGATPGRAAASNCRATGVTWYTTGRHAWVSRHRSKVS